jgi:hypothetical protein
LHSRCTCSKKYCVLYGFCRICCQMQALFVKRQHVSAWHAQIPSNCFLTSKLSKCTSTRARALHNKNALRIIPRFVPRTLPNQTSTFPFTTEATQKNIDRSQSLDLDAPSALYSEKTLGNRSNCALSARRSGVVRGSRCLSVHGFSIKVQKCKAKPLLALNSKPRVMIPWH